MAHTVFSRHATIRAQQRGIKPAEIDAVLRYADMEARRGDGCFSTWISKRELRRLGPSTPEGVSTERLQGLVVLQSDDQTCITTFRNRRSGAYRRSIFLRRKRRTRRFIRRRHADRIERRRIRPFGSQERTTQDSPQNTHPPNAEAYRCRPRPSRRLSRLK
jgi:hypothetical protein